MSEPQNPETVAPVIVAHRAGNHPTTAVQALRRVEMIEADVHVFRGRIELRHEKVLRPTSRLWERWYLLPRHSRVTRMAELLAAIPPDTPLLLDLKCFSTGAARRIRRAVPARHRVVVSSRAWWILRVFGDRPNTVRLRSCGAGWQLRLAQMLPGLGQQIGIVAHERLLTGPAIAAARSQTPLLYTWAVASAQRGQELTAAGVSGMIVDDLNLEWPGLD